METKLFNIVCYGDLYRIYVDSDGEIITVHFYPFMGTQFEEMNFEDVPQEVKDKYETMYTS